MKTSRPLIQLAIAMALAAAICGCGAGSDPVAPGAVTDNAPPQAPTGLTPGLSDISNPVLEWSANSEPDLAGYQIYQYSPDPSRDNAYELVATVGASATEWQLPDVTETEITWFRLRAIDGAGNRSAVSTAAQITLVAASSGSDAPGEDIPPVVRRH